MISRPNIIISPSNKSGSPDKDEMTEREGYKTLLIIERKTETEYPVKMVIDLSVTFLGVDGHSPRLR
jgi:hypothetical protein